MALTSETATSSMPADMLKSPRCRAADLGLPMPDDPHAVSACLPLWRHNIGYEENDSNVIDALQAAYPRFCLHPTVRRLCQELINKSGASGLPFVNVSAAQRAEQYLKAHAVDCVSLSELGESAVAASVADCHFDILKQYWQHAGENVSSRVAERILNGKSVKVTEDKNRSAVRNRVAALQQAKEKDVFLFASGMAAIAAGWRTVQSLDKGPTCQFGFPYVDTLKIQERFQSGRHIFLPNGDAQDLHNLEELCRSAPPSAVFCEVPTNPLLVSPDIVQLRHLADHFRFLLIVDDTLGACCNVSVLQYADIVVTSLTKYFSGYGNVLAGALVLNENSARYAELQSSLMNDFQETLADCDLEVLKKNSDDVDNRMHTINQNARQLADFLAQHSAVNMVYYPTDCPHYERVRRPNGGYGGLLSIVLNDAEHTTPAAFDALEVCKGPNLGTNFTLCCPYTILAHYNELGFAESCGVSRWLLRISVGTEDFAELERRFAAALSRL